LLEVQDVGGPRVITRRFLEPWEGSGTCKMVEDLYLCVSDKVLTSSLPH